MSEDNKEMSDDDPFQKELDHYKNQCQFLTMLLWLSLNNRGPLRASVAELKNWPETRALSIQGRDDGKIECKATTQSQSSNTPTTPTAPVY